MTDRFEAYPNCGVFSNKLIDLLKDGKIGDILTDETMTSVINKDTSCGGNGYGYLTTAINQVLRHHDVHWKRVPKAGHIKCLDGNESVSTAESSLHRIKRIGNKTSRHLSVARKHGGDLTRINVAAAQIGMIDMLSKPSVRAAIEEKQCSGEIDKSKFLESFKKI